MKSALIACGICLWLTAPALAQRLPGTVLPVHYALWFAPDLRANNFRGHETIRVRLTASSRAITLNAAELTFADVSISAGGRTQSASVRLDDAAETATLTVPLPIPAGAATIEIAFTGVLNDKLRGFYRSRANGRSYAVTQMEATDARRAFPCFDEPAYKATFDLSLMVDSGDTAISNGALRSDTPGPDAGMHTLRFATTPKMSTYLVAMFVGDFACREGSADGTVIRICSTPDKQALTAFALEAAQQQLRFYNEFTGIKYPWGKLDIVAVPDFAAGAMENAGAIAFRERLLLVDPARASLDARRRVAGIISHELAHMWFGNLVTMKWWDDIWLNEGFATWMENKPLAAWRPEWRVGLTETADTRGALGIDALRSTRPIRTSVETPDEINDVFDGIAYEKTAAVLRMLEGFVGPEAFRTAVASYLRKFSFSNAAGEDFWNEVAARTGRPVDRIMRGFVEQAGAPVISIRTACHDTSTEVTLHQERFTGVSPSMGPAGPIWAVPVCVTTGNGQPRCEVLDRRDRTYTVPACTSVFANADSRGYYFSEYTPDAVRALARRVHELAPAERLGLLGDEWWMVRGGRHDVGLYMDLAASLADDDTPSVTSAISTRLTYAASHLVHGDDRARYQSWIRASFLPALRALGLPGPGVEPDERQSRRAALVELLGISGNDADLQQTARALALSYIDRSDSVPGTLAPAVLQVAAINGDAALYDLYLAQVEARAGQPEEYYRFFNALGSFSDPALVRRTLEFSLSPSVRTQDIGTLLAQLLSREASQEAAWAFTKAQWPVLLEKLGTFQGVPTIINALGAFCSAERAADVRQFFERNPMSSASRSLQQSLERIDECAALAARQTAPMAAWLRSQPQGQTGP